MNAFLKTKKDIAAWLKLQGINSYRLVKSDSYGFIVNVTGDVNLSNKNLSSIAVKFGSVTGDFDCSDNAITSLLGSPEVVGESFDCSSNQLLSLTGAPRVVSSSFNCAHNGLTSLRGSPRILIGNFSCSNNSLTTLEGCPEHVGGGFNCASNLLTSIEFTPFSVGGKGFLCGNNPGLGEIQKIVSIEEIHSYQNVYSEKDKLVKALLLPHAFNNPHQSPSALSSASSHTTSPSLPSAMPHGPFPSSQPTPSPPRASFNSTHTFKK